MRRHTSRLTVQGPWSLQVSRTFWEGFAPAALPGTAAPGDRLQTVFRVEADWTRAEATVTEHGNIAQIAVSGPGDLHAAADQVARFLALDVDGSDWPAVGKRDPVIGRAQKALPGLRPCGFHSPYEAAAWAVLSQRLRIAQAARLRADITRRYGQDGAFPAPDRLRTLDLDLPARKTEYLHAVADAALDGILDGPTLRAVDPVDAVERVRQVKGLGPFAAELVVLRGANTPDALAHHEARLTAEIAEQYGPGATLETIADTWRPYRTWAAVYLRALREQRTREIGTSTATT